MTVTENLAFISRLYGYKTSETIEFVREFSGLNKEFGHKFGELTSENKMKIGFFATLAIPFDYYLFDGNLVIGDAKLQEVCLQVVMARMQTSSCILFTHAPKAAARFSNIYVVGDTETTFFNDLAQAAAHFKKISTPAESSD